MKCPNCGAAASGRFCAHCGALLDSAACASCKAPLVAGANFCNQCGTRVRRRARTPWPWLIGGTLLLSTATIIWLLLSTSTPQPAQPATAADMSAAPPGSPPALSGNMRENADRLFNRIMETRERGDTVGARQFLPMAITAYQSSDLDADGYYHLSILQSIAGQGADAMTSARAILDEDPTHLLGLHAAAMAARAANDRAQAKQFYQKLLDEFDVESAKTRPEYSDHAQLISALREEARSYLATR